MGRFPNIAAAKAATGAAKGKLYGMYAREIYQVAKSGGATPEGNPSLKRLIEKAKKEQVPADVIKRALDKVNSGVDESFETLNYEVFGPNGSTLIVSCLTDNPNRSISSVKAVLNKCKCKIGVQGSVSFNYDNLCIVGVKGTDEESVMNALIENDCDIEDIENDCDFDIVEEPDIDDSEVAEYIVENPKEVVVQFPIISDIKLDEHLPFFRSISAKLAAL